MSETTYNCPTCRRRRRFEQPPCREGHGSNCPEWVCTFCGTALFTDLELVLGAGRRHTTRVA